MRYLAALLLCSAPGLCQAAPTLALPATASRTAEAVETLGSYALPTGPWSNGRIATMAAEGEVSQTSWRIRDAENTTMGLLVPLREQLKAEGFDVLFECDTDGCGGFDFRFATPVLPEPEMHVDLGDFRFLSARRDAGANSDYVSLLVSKSADSGYVQMIRVGAAVSRPIMQAAPPEPVPGPQPASLAKSLDLTGSVVLDDLSFETGSVALGADDFASLRALADYLKVNPDRHIALVGHTDAKGSLEANISLSRRRAQSVAQHLVTAYGVNPTQLSADGVGFLSPRASNLTDEGRTQNRRVEAMITSTQ